MKKAKQKQNGAWVEVEGTIVKGSYHGDIPVIKIENIVETNVPNDEFVYPPDGSYVITNRWTNEYVVFEFFL